MSEIRVYLIPQPRNSSSLTARLLGQLFSLNNFLALSVIKDSNTLFFSVDTNYEIKVFTKIDNIKHQKSIDSFYKKNIDILTKINSDKDIIKYAKILNLTITAKTENIIWDLKNLYLDSLILDFYNIDNLILLELKL